MPISHRDHKTKRKRCGYSLALNRAQLCPYCKSKPQYNKKKRQYICPKCGAKVNADRKGNPMGSVANKQLAYKRYYAHSIIEPLGEQVGRNNVYKYLDTVLGRSRYSTHTAKMSEIQLDILIHILENTTAEKICERMGIMLKEDKDKQWREKVKSVVDEVLKEEFEPYKKMIDDIYLKHVYDRFVFRLKGVGLKPWWKVLYRSLSSGAGVCYIQTPLKVYKMFEYDTREQLVSSMNQLKVPFKVWEGQEKPTIIQWMRKYKEDK